MISTDINKLFIFIAKFNALIKHTRFLRGRTLREIAFCRACWILTEWFRSLTTILCSLLLAITFYTFVTGHILRVFSLVMLYVPN